jgi:BirA family transcriptional regulator, biotin operon repressor / biotin---[acetyl-CoA-carboxylase] ligase
VSLAVTPPVQPGEPGEHMGTTSLYDEGAGDVSRTAVIEALATRLLAWLHTWQHTGFRSIHDHWLYRAEGHDTETVIDGKTGRVLGLDEDGNLLFKPTNGPVTVCPYLPHVGVWP